MVSDFTAANVPDQKGRTFLITGADSGIGYETTKVLAARGAQVLMGCVDLQGAKAARERICGHSPGATLSIIPIDLASLASIKEAANMVEQEAEVDVLINNAGVLKNTKELSKDGFELSMAVNHLGAFALTGLLLPGILQRANARIVMTSSMAYRAGRTSFDAMLNVESFNGSRAYADTKLANLWFAFELHRRFQAAGSTTAAIACHPGAAVTGILRDRSAWDRWVFNLFSRSYNTPEKAAWPTLAAATSADATSGEYIGPGGYANVRGPAKTMKPGARATDPEAARRMWERSVELTGVEPLI